jgi:DNA-binding MarR family transcriptional regulator
MTAGFTSDMSANVQSALIDVWFWLYHGFFAPGDHLLSLLRTHAPRVAELLTLDAASQGGVLSGLISGVVWLAAIILIVVICKFIRDVDRTLTAYVGRLYEGLQRTWRVVARRLAIAFRSYALRRQARLASTEVSEQLALTVFELEVLQSHAALPPAHLLTPSEIASALGMRSADVEQALATLKKLSFVERSFGAGDGEDGYRLTRAGQVFLAACNRGQRIKGQDRRQPEDQPRKREAATPRAPSPARGLTAVSAARVARD